MSHLSAEDIEKRKADMARNWRASPKPYESYVLTNNNASIRQAKARFEELWGEGYNSEAAEPGWDGEPPARLTLGLEGADGMSAADILQVR